MQPLLVKRPKNWTGFILKVSSDLPSNFQFWASQPVGPLVQGLPRLMFVASKTPWTLIRDIMLYSQPQFESSYKPW